MTELGNEIAIEVLVNSRHSCRLCYMRVIPYLAVLIPSPCGQGAFQREGYWEPNKGLVLCTPCNPNPYVVCKQVNSQNFVCKFVKVASCVGIMCENHDV